MIQTPPLKDLTLETRLFRQRVICMLVLVFVLTGILLARLVSLQIIEQERYTTLSEQNQFALLPLSPRRGLIYDRNGVLLAENIPVYNLELIPNAVPDIEDTLTRLTQLINISPQERELFSKQLRQRRSSDSITVKVKLSDDEVANFAVNQYHFPGVMVRAQLIRHYPLGENLSHVLGYVGRLNEKELQQNNAKAYAATQFIGKENIEKYYEGILHGKVGFEQIETNANGQTVRVLTQKPPTSGSDLYLTIDSGLQIVAQRALKGHRGAIVAIDIKTGDILTLASAPTFDPNPFVKGISYEAYNDLLQSPDHPMYNRAARGQYPMASTIKPFIALKALHEHVITPQTIIDDPGYFKLENSKHLYKDWAAHGEVDLKKAITVSCDTYFYRLAMQLNIAPISQVMHEFGFGEKSDLDLPGEVAGLVADPEWKAAHYQVPWYPGDTINAGIGQGFMLTSPLQLAVATATLGNQGKRYKPHLLKEIRMADNHILIRTPTLVHEVTLQETKAWDAVIEAMSYVVLEGTGRRFGKNIPYTVAAKTGTAQVYSTRHRNTRSDKDMPKHLRDHSLFIAFAPVDDPQIALAIVAENEKRLAPSLARKLLDYYFLGSTDETG